MATQIKRFPISRLTIGATCDFHSKVRQLIDETTAAALHVEELLPGYQSAGRTLASIVNRGTAFVTTKALRKADTRRERGCGAIVNQVNVARKCIVEAKRRAADRLAPQLAPYKGIGHHEYSKLTMEIRSMLGVLGDAANAEALQALGLEADVEALRAANDEFARLFAQRAAEVSERLPRMSLSSVAVTRDINRRYAEITRTVNAYAIASPTEAIESFIRALNARVTVYGCIASRRSTAGPGEGGGDNG